jgi:hypothetical protein
MESSSPTSTVSFDLILKGPDLNREQSWLGATCRSALNGRTNHVEPHNETGSIFRAHALGKCGRLLEGILFAYEHVRLWPDVERLRSEQRTIPVRVTCRSALNGRTDHIEADDETGSTFRAHALGKYGRLLEGILFAYEHVRLWPDPQYRSVTCRSALNVWLNRVEANDETGSAFRAYALSERSRLPQPIRFAYEQAQH